MFINNKSNDKRLLLFISSLILIANSKGALINRENHQNETIILSKLSNEVKKTNSEPKITTIKTNDEENYSLGNVKNSSSSSTSPKSVDIITNSETTSEINEELSTIISLPDFKELRTNSNFELNTKNGQGFFDRTTTEDSTISTTLDLTSFTESTTNQETTIFVEEQLKNIETSVSSSNLNEETTTATDTNLLTNNTIESETIKSNNHESFKNKVQNNSVPIYAVTLNDLQSNINENSTNGKSLNLTNGADILTSTTMINNNNTKIENLNHKLDKIESNNNTKNMNSSKQIIDWSQIMKNVNNFTENFTSTEKIRITTEKLKPLLIKKTKSFIVEDNITTTNDPEIIIESTIKYNPNKSKILENLKKDTNEIKRSTGTTSATAVTTATTTDFSTTEEINFNNLNISTIVTTTEGNSLSNLIEDSTISTIYNTNTDLFSSTVDSSTVPQELNSNISEFTTISSKSNILTTTVENILQDNTTTLLNTDSFTSTTMKMFTETSPETSIETNFIDKNDDLTITKTNLKSTVSPNLLKPFVTTELIIIASDSLPNPFNDNKIDILTTESNENEKYKIFLTSNVINPKYTSTEATTLETNPNKNTTIINSTISPIESEGIEPSSNDPDYNVVIAISVSVIGIVALILLVGFLYVMRKRQKQLTYGQRCRPVSLDAYSLDNISVYNSVRRKAALRASKRSYGNVAFDDPSLARNNLSTGDLGKFVEKKSVIYDEFKNIPQIIARADEVPQGCEDKNRYANIIPLPETRVLLEQINNDESTEYINANYVRGPKDVPNYYIACQAPLENTVTDFWRMIWEQNSRVIIMATDLIENGIEKCAEYLPASITLDNHIVYGNYQITLKNREVKEKYAVSKLRLKNMKTNLWREITHFWYQWPNTGVPTDEAGVIAMLLESRNHLKVAITDQVDEENIRPVTLTNGSKETNRSSFKNQGPLTVHCSPGTGRTGTLITIDIALRSLEDTKHVDIPQIVYFVRRGRASAVQTKEQYDFIYKVINMYGTKISSLSNE